LTIGFSTALSPNRISAIALGANGSSIVSDADAGLDLGFLAGTVMPVSFLPQTSAVLAGLHGSNGWFRGPVTVSLTTVQGRYR